MNRQTVTAMVETARERMRAAFASAEVTKRHRVAGELRRVADWIQAGRADELTMQRAMRFIRETPR